MRKKLTIQILAILGIALISAFTWIGYNYDNWLTWCMDKNNITALCFFVIAVLYIIIIALRVMYLKLETSKKYYQSESDRYYEERDIARRDNYELREQKEKLKVELITLKQAISSKKKK